MSTRTYVFLDTDNFYHGAADEVAKIGFFGSLSQADFISKQLLGKSFQKSASGEKKKQECENAAKNLFRKNQLNDAREHFGMGDIRSRLNADKLFAFDALSDTGGSKQYIELSPADYCHINYGFVTGQKLNQKAVDTNLAITALKFAQNNSFDRAIIISGDLDYYPLILELIKLGKQVIVASFKNRLSEELAKVGDASLILDIFDILAVAKQKISFHHPQLIEVVNATPSCYESPVLITNNNNQKIYLSSCSAGPGPVFQFPPNQNKLDFGFFNRNFYLSKINNQLRELRTEKEYNHLSPCITIKHDFFCKMASGNLGDHMAYKILENLGISASQIIEWHKLVNENVDAGSRGTYLQVAIEKLK